MVDTGVNLAFMEPLLQLLQRGGPVVAVLLLMSLVGTTVLLAKMLQFWLLGIGRREVLFDSLREWRKGHWQVAMELLKDVPSHPVGRVMDAGMHGLLAEQEEVTVREEVTRIARNHLEKLRAWLKVLELIASLSPLLGLLGTVIGMINAFQRLESAGNQVDPALLSGGIWQALLTTAVGLIVAIPALVGHQWLERRVERCAHTMEDCMTRVFTSYTEYQRVQARRSDKSSRVDEDIDATSRVDRQRNDRFRGEGNDPEFLHASS